MDDASFVSGREAVSDLNRQVDSFRAGGAGTQAFVSVSPEQFRDRYAPACSTAYVRMFG
jgi:hypothetical protein